MKQDRFLLAILIAIGALVIVALGLFFVRKGSQNYGPEDIPEGVVRNYVLALHKQDYARAYGYLKDGDGKPDIARFRQVFMTREMNISDVAVQIGDATLTGSEAIVDLTLLHASNGPFSDTYRETSRAIVVQNEAGQWKISDMPYPYWEADWYGPNLKRSTVTPAGPGG